MREVILDTETTGVDPAGGHRIVEIGCLELMGGMRTGNVFQAYLNPERDVPEEAYRVHGLSLEFLLDKPLFAERVDDFLAFIADSPLVIHNAAFDLKFVNAELARLGFPAIEAGRAVDTLLIARRKFPGAPASLDALCKRFGVDGSARDKHGALLDAELLAEVYVELLGGRQSMLALDTLDGKGTNGAAAKDIGAKPPLPAREFSPAAEELKAHAELLTKLKNPLWAEN